MLARPTCRAAASVTTLCAALALMLLALAPTSSAADDLADFNVAIEQFAAHNRVAIGYLRTDNTELVAVEIDRMKAAWANVMSRFGTHPPQALRANPRYEATLADVQRNIGEAEGLMDGAKAHQAITVLQSVREKLAALRKAGGITVLADCVLETNAAMAAIFIYEKTPPDWKKPDLARKSDTLGAITKRCDTLADADTRKNPEFRRLIDGTLNSLTFVPKAIAERDHDLLVRVIGELRAFDNLLTFRFG
jgi:hypothetical protein